MVDPRTHFGTYADQYRKYRPAYPPELFARIAELPASHHLAWDCGAGNGQAARGALEHFARVVATDASPAQVAEADPAANLDFVVARAEAAPLRDGSVDLTTVAQALHWFELDTFFDEVRRVSAPGGALAVWSYQFLSVTPDVDELVREFHRDVVGPFWLPERRHVEDRYAGIPIPFDTNEPEEITLETRWSLDDLLGYLRTWSAVRFFQERQGVDPVDELEPPLAEAWGHVDARAARWPITLRTARVRPA